MPRVVQFVLVLAAGVAAVVSALLIPIHLRAVDPRAMVEIASRGKSLPEAAVEWAQRNPAAAKVLIQTSEMLHLPGTDDALEAVRSASEAGEGRPETVLHDMERDAAGRIQVQEIPVAQALRSSANRARLRASIKSPEAVRILQNLSITNLAVFAPVGSAAGRPLEISVLTAAFLMETGAYGANTSESTLRQDILQLSAEGAATSVRAGELEDFYLDMFALARRFSSEQVKAFVACTENLAAFDGLARWFQQDARELPLIYSAVILSGDGGAVADYYTRFPETAVDDIRTTLTSGVKAMTDLVHSRKPLYRSAFHNEVLSDPHLQFIVRPFLRLAVRSPALAFVCKFILLFIGGLLLTYAFRLARPLPAIEAGWVPKFGFARRLTFAGLFLMLMVLLGEPYLVKSAEQQPDTLPEPPRIHLNPLAAITPNPQSPGSMSSLNTLIAMLVFFVLQGSIYLVCLTKLAEIRRQSLSSAMKLKLMENEENLFDAGLYLGLFGTAASLILLTIGWIKPSLVSAYSSTLFGILFVAILKIFHVRPYKRRLILESAAEAA